MSIVKVNASLSSDQSLCGLHKAIKCSLLSGKNFREFIQWTKLQNSVMSVNVGKCPLQSVIVANAVLLLLNVACHLLDRQIARLAADFENNGGFSERMYKRRLKKKEDI